MKLLIHSQTSTVQLTLLGVWLIIHRQYSTKIALFPFLYSIDVITMILETILTPVAHHHDDVITWKHFLRYWPFALGIHRWPVNSPHKGQWRGALITSLIWPWTNGWVNIRKASGFRRHQTHYDTTVMILVIYNDWRMRTTFSTSHFAQTPLLFEIMYISM